MEAKFLRTINTIPLTFPSFPLSPKQCCSLCTPVHFTLKVFDHPNIVWRREWRTICGIQAVREVHIMLHLNI